MLEVQLMEIDEEKSVSPRKKAKSKSKVKDPKRLENRTCKKCKFIADSVLELLKHVDDSKINCSEFYAPTYVCYICMKKFMLDVKKREHVRRDHIEYASKDCPHCIRSRLKTSTAYELHVRQHFAQPDFLCTSCGKGFFKKELYDLHMRSHDDNFWLYCDHCEYKSKAKCLMTTHLKHHFGIRPFVCDKCSKPFHKSNALNQHMFQVHKTTNKGCYRCEKCDYCFLHRRDIIRHNVYCEGQSKNPVNCPRVRFAELDPACVIKELLDDENCKNVKVTKRD
jgi:KRAB domain-containing zinc finger protein